MTGYNIADVIGDFDESILSQDGDESSFGEAGLSEEKIVGKWLEMAIPALARAGLLNDLTLFSKCYPSTVLHSLNRTDVSPPHLSWYPSAVLMLALHRAVQPPLY